MILLKANDYNVFLRNHKSKNNENFVPDLDIIYGRCNSSNRLHAAQNYI